MLSPEVQQAFGGFAAWRKGYARTVSNAPEGVTVTPAVTGATVGLTLRAGGPRRVRADRRAPLRGDLAARPHARGLARDGGERAQAQRPRALLSAAV